jgi:hypothetical protein
LPGSSPKIFTSSPPDLSQNAQIATPLSQFNQSYSQKRG